MFIPHKSVWLFFFILLLISSQLLATNKRKDDPRQETKSSGSLMNSKTVVITQSTENIELPTTNGNIVSLRRIDKSIVDTPDFNIKSNRLASMDKTPSSADLIIKLTEQKELYELSRELGIYIRDNRYLNLYREVAYWIGVPYRYGAMSSKAVDCSGFASLVYKAVYDKILPRVSFNMSIKFGETITKDNLAPGDLVFFATRGRKKINHVGIYLGEDKFIHASRSQGVVVSSLNDSYYIRSWSRGAKVD